MLVSLDIANVGAVPISLQEGGFLVTKRKNLVRREEGRISVDPMQGWPSLPCDLAQGGGYTLLADATKLREELLGAVHLGFRLTHIFFRDATERRYEKKLPRRFLRNLHASKTGNN